MSSAIVLFEFAEETHFELVADKQVLVCCLVEKLPVRLDMPDLLQVASLRHLAERILQSDKTNTGYLPHEKSQTQRLFQSIQKIFQNHSVNIHFVSDIQMYDLI